MGKKVLPDFGVLATSYKGKGWSADGIKKFVGGSVNSEDIDDTCIVRISGPLNDAGQIIPVWSKKFATRIGNDGRWYGLRVDEFWPYMIDTYGQPTRSSKKPLDKKLFQGIRGIIGFKVSMFKGATGHFTLWDGFDLLYGGEDHDYFSIADDAALWEAGTLRVSQPEA